MPSTQKEEERTEVGWPIRQMRMAVVEAETTTSSPSMLSRWNAINSLWMPMKAFPVHRPWRAIAVAVGGGEEEGTTAHLNGKFLFYSERRCSFVHPVFFIYFILVGESVKRAGSNAFDPKGAWHAHADTIDQLKMVLLRAL